MTKEQRTRKRIGAALIALCLCVVVALGVSAFFAMRQNSQEQSAASIRSAILDTAMQCAAVEGSFPSSLKYLEESYGLRVNHDDFVVVYECFAENVVPSVTVMPR